MNYNGMSDMTQEPISYAYLRSDLCNMLTAIAITLRACAPSDEFTRGAEAALLAVAVATGIAPKPQGTQDRR